MDLITEMQEVKRFDLKTEQKLLTKLSKILAVALQPMNENQAEQLINKGIMDNSQVCMVEGLTPEARVLLTRFFDRDNLENLKNTPSLSYSVLGSSKFSLDYMNKLIAFLEVSDESVRLNVCLDYPLTMENKHFKVILAPRCDN